MTGVLLCLASVAQSYAQVVNRGLTPAANTARSYTDASIARDSDINQPLDLLNDFYPMIEVYITDHENVRRRSDFSEDDLKFTVVPSLAYRTSFGRHDFYAAYVGTFTYHNDIDQEDARANALNAQLGLDLSKDWDLRLFAGIGDGFEERGVSGSRAFNQLIVGVDSGPDEFDYSRWGADLIFGKKGRRLVGVLGFEHYESSYKNNFQGDENAFGGRDRENDIVHLDLSYQIGDKTAVFGRIQKSEVDYDRTQNSLDSEQTDWLVGLRWKPTNALSGVVGVGNSDRDYDDASRVGYDGNIYYANLNYAVTPFSSFSLAASRVVEEPGDAESDFYESELIGVSLDSAISERVAFNVYAKWVDDDYNTNRQDQFFDYGVGLDYAWRSWLSAGIFFGDIERESSLRDLEYDDRYFGIRLRSDLRPFLRGRGSDDEDDFYRYPRPNGR